MLYAICYVGKDNAMYATIRRQRLMQIDKHFTLKTSVIVIDQLLRPTHSSQSGQFHGISIISNILCKTVPHKILIFEGSAISINLKGLNTQY